MARYTESAKRDLFLARRRKSRRSEMLEVGGKRRPRKAERERIIDAALRRADEIGPDTDDEYAKREITKTVKQECGSAAAALMLAYWIGKIALLAYQWWKERNAA